MKYSTYSLAFLMCLFLSHMGQVRADKDKRLAQISASQLQQAIAQTPLESPVQQQLLSRARHSHLMGVAYTQYTDLCRRQPNNPSANLLRGVSAEYLQSDSMEPELKKLYEPYARGDLFSVAASCLARAVKLAPNSSAANLEAGFFFWQFGNDLPRGLSLLKKSLQLAPDNPRIHAMWGDVYANPEGRSYDLGKAVDHLETAINLEPTYAFPHELLASVYSRLGSSAKAAQEMSKYQSLLP